MLGIINFLGGNVEIIIEGAFPERFLNVCSQNGIAFWGLERISESKISARVKRQGYRRLSPMAERCMCTVSVVKERGAPFFFLRFRKRYALLLGMLACVCMLYVMSMFIWDIDVVGNDQIPKEKILQGLKSIGVGIGTYSPSIDPESVKHQMLVKVDGLSWLTVNVSGSRAVVEVRERIEAPAIINEDIPCNIVAAKTGLIVKMDTLKGSPQSAVGMTVKEGDLLISGIIDSQKVGMRYVHAMGEVWARTWYELSAVMPLDIDGKEYTGEKKTRRALVFAGNRINLYFNGSIYYEHYDKIIKNTELRLPGERKLPAALVAEEFTEYSAAAMKIREEAAEELLRAGLSERLERMTGEGKIISKEFTSQIIDGVLEVTLVCECEEQIVRTIPIITEHNIAAGLE